ncbi:hypothetical protein [Streptomyces bacillaris]
MVKESVQLRCLIAAAIHQPVGNDEELAVVRVQGDFTGSPVDIPDLLAQSAIPESRLPVSDSSGDSAMPNQP